MKPAATMLRNALKAAVLPRFMRARRTPMTAVTKIEYRGRPSEGLTRLMYPLKGTPLSLAKDQRRREAPAITPLPAAVKRKRTKLVIAVAAALLFVAWAKISIKGNPVGVSKAAVTSPMQNKSAIKSASPKTPLTIIVVTMAQGTTVEALWTSSAIWLALSAPVKAKTLAIIPTKTDNPSLLQSPPLIKVVKTSLADA